MAKQEKYKKEFEKLDFKFETKLLNLPTSADSQVIPSQEETQETDALFTQMGRDIGDILAIYGKAKSGYKSEGNIVDFYE